MLDKLGSGWKTNTGGIILIISGVCGLVMGFIDADSSQAMPLAEGIAVISAGFAMLGIGHKIERINE